MLKQLKKVMISFIAGGLMITTLNINVFASVNTENLNPGEVTQEKSAKWVDYANGIAEISFDVAGKNAEEPLDIAIIYDNSGSMQTDNLDQNRDYFSSSWYHTANAATLFTNDLLKNSDNKVALIPFSDVLIDGKTIHKNPSDYFETHALIYDKDGKPDLKKMIAVNMMYDSYEKGHMTMDEFVTYCEEDLQILPSELYEKENVHNALIPFTNDAEVLTDAINNLYPSYAGTTNYEIALKEAENQFANSTAKQKIIVMISDGKPDKGKDGVKIANELKQKGITIYTIGTNLSEEDSVYLEKIASKENNVPLFTSVDKDELASTLAHMRKQFNVAAHDAIISDTINTDYFEYYSDASYKPSINGVEATSEEFTIAQDKGSVTWNIGDIKESTKTLRFYVKVKDSLLNNDLLKDDLSFLNNAGSYDTNKDANLTYSEVNSNKLITTGHEMATPKLDVTTATLKTTNFVSDHNGNKIRQLSTETSSKKALGITYKVTPQKTIIEDGITYELLSSDNMTQSVTFSNNLIHAEFEFRYVQQLQVSFDTNGFGQFEDASKIKSVKVDNDTMSIKQLPEVSNIPSNMHFVGWNTKPDGTGEAFTSSTVVQGNMTVYAQYTIDPVVPEEPEEPIHYYVTFDTNGYGQFDDASALKQAEVDKDSMTVRQLPEVKNIPSNMHFASWNTKPDGTGETFTSSTYVQGNMTVYAQYTIDPVQPEEPNQPDVPVQPEEPNQPDVPVQPEQPNQPDVPVQPEQPNQPDVPVQPIQPVQPETPIVTPIVPEVQAPVAVAIPVADVTIPVPVQNAPVIDNTQDTETVPEDETPLDDAPQIEEVPEQETPLANGQSGASWALVNLLCSAATVLIGIVILFGKRKKEEDEEEDTKTAYERRKWTKIACAITALVSIIVFVITEDMSLPMSFIDKWTIVMVAFLIVQGIVLVIAKKWKKSDDSTTVETQA